MGHEPTTVRSGVKGFNRPSHSYEYLLPRNLHGAFSCSQHVGLVMTTTAGLLYHWDGARGRAREPASHGCKKDSGCKILFVRITFAYMRPRPHTSDIRSKKKVSRNY